MTDWTEEEEQAMAGATYEWIRMDADIKWIAKIQFEQPDCMWLSHLQRDRDVVAQMEVSKMCFVCMLLLIPDFSRKSIHALSGQPTPIVSSTFTKAVLVTKYFFRVRCEAALALVTVCRSLPLGRTRFKMTRFRVLPRGFISLGYFQAVPEVLYAMLRV